MRRWQGAGLALAALALLVVVRALSAPPWPDDWDGIGFVESVTRFDLDRFVPHPPGYPVYVALLRVASLFTRHAVVAANAVGVLTGAAATALLGLAVRRAWGARHAASVVLLVSLAPLVWRATSGVGSEAPALAFVAGAIYGATRERYAALWVGACVGLGLGVRLSWAPLFVPLLFLAPRGARLRAVLAASAGATAWALPFVAVVGGRHLLALARVHARGHFEVWGGSAISEPGAPRAVWLARDVLVDGLGVGADALGVAIAIVAAALLVHGLRSQEWRQSVKVALALVSPYLLWIAIGQNLHAQPRHTLPLVVLLTGALGLAAASSRRAAAVGVLLALLVGARTWRDARDRELIAPPGEQLVLLARSLPAAVATFAGPSARFFELEPDPEHPGVNAGSLGDVRLALGRMRRLPSRVLVTNEIEGLAASTYPLERVATLCRPPRIERRAPCLDVFEWKAPFLRR
jgi:hypothetical protein